MAKRRKTVVAGRLVFETAYTAALPSDTEHVRQAKMKMSSAARRRLNLKAASRQLELLIAANFTPRDLVVTLTYDDEHLPQSRAEAVKNLKKFFRALREARRRQKLPDLKYIYVTESKHEHGRWHHHVILNGTGNDMETIRSLWTYGEQVNIEMLDDTQYRALAEYLAKEPREAGSANGKRMWTPSKGLTRPTVQSDWIDDRATLEPPPGATVLESVTERNEWGEYVYLKYLLPDPKPRRCRPSRRKKNE